MDFFRTLLPEWCLVNRSAGESRYYAGGTDGKWFEPLRRAGLYFFQGLPAKCDFYRE
jgi:hypothetical protein